MSVRFWHNPWAREAGTRLGAHWLIKTFAIPLFFTAFFRLYFALLQHPVFPVTLMPLTAVDRWIGFQPLGMVPYLSLWIYVLLVPALLRGRREMTVYATAVCALSIVGLGFFYLWPSAVPTPDIDWSRHPGFGFLKRVDATGNACPSLHVAFAVFTAIWLERLLRQMRAPFGLRIANAAWSAAIVYSTLAIKQHVAVDAIAGIALGGAAGLASPRRDAPLFGERYSFLNRQSLAFGVSVSSKIALFSLGLQHSHLSFAIGLFLAPDLWIFAGLLLPNANGLVPTATCFATAGRDVWLTIDDGPFPASTPAMLDLLDRHGARATFFLVGIRAAAHPRLVSEILRRGHSIGNHTQTHPLAEFWLSGPGRTAREIDGCGNALAKAGAPPVVWFRPPAGIKTFFLRRALAVRGLTLVGWSGRGREHLHEAIDRPLRRLTRALRPGAILLVHESDAHAARQTALVSALLDQLSDAGFRCVLPRADDLRSSFAERRDGVARV